MALILGSAAAVAWLALLMLPSRPWSTRERIGPQAAGALPDLADVSVVIPARDEARHIGATLAALAGQGRFLEAIVVDDQSRDATASIAAACDDGAAGGLRVRLVCGEPLPPGWAGKLWALEQGIAHAEREFVLLLDADIELAPGMLHALRSRVDDGDCDFVSVMADLNCESFWERLLAPPFVYFFKLIYPFAGVNDPRSRTAAAAGGCVLLRADVLRAVGAFASLKNALIDDCTLARLAKRSGARLWLGLSHGVKSRRRYDSFAAFSRMIVRSAFTQLNYSLTLLLLVTMLMAVVFIGPWLAIWNYPDATSISIGMSGLFAMYLAYVPIQRWYAMPLVWLASLPVAAALYLGLTWASAIAYWRGTRAEWKGRAYAVD